MDDLKKVLLTFKSLDLMLREQNKIIKFSRIYCNRKKI